MFKKYIAAQIATLLLAVFFTTFPASALDIPALRQKAEAGDAQAQYDLANLYLHGKGVEWDKEQAKAWYNKAFEGFSKAAAEGDAVAQCKLGQCHYFVFDRDPDYTKEAEWFQKAADQGNAEAQRLLSYAYLTGRGVVKNPKRGIELLTKAAEQGDVEAQERLGYIWLYGFAENRVDEKLSEKWFKKSLETSLEKANTGDVPSMLEVGRIYSWGKDEGMIEVNKPAALEWFQKAADLGDIEAQYYVAEAYKKGEGIAKDRDKAMEWYRKSAEQGYSYAQVELGNELRLGPEKDAKQALEWYRKAEKLEYPSLPQYQIGQCYENGEGVEQDYIEAASWYRKATKQSWGGSKAAFRLGYFYENGLGVPIDKDKADEWYRQAADRGSAEAEGKLGLSYTIPKYTRQALNWVGYYAGF